ncbi:hypothetical protein F4778DRAFT_797089 [Xylariomycetidae sp. FL2044]|nr:hypothetical protein F4778DRAFT_797089 [Xylariomycetidae sp. FL2044]
MCGKEEHVGMKQLDPTTKELNFTGQMCDTRLKSFPWVSTEQNSERAYHYRKSCPDHGVLVKRHYWVNCDCPGLEPEESDLTEGLKQLSVEDDIPPAEQLFEDSDQPRVATSSYPSHPQHRQSSRYVEENRHSREGSPVQDSRRPQLSPSQRSTFSDRMSIDDNGQTQLSGDCQESSDDCEERSGGYEEPSGGYEEPDHQPYAQPYQQTYQQSPSPLSNWSDRSLRDIPPPSPMSTDDNMQT